eukprot:Selendium_serpulae@DN2842_c0_g1_i1.p1
MSSSATQLPDGRVAIPIATLPGNIRAFCLLELQGDLDLPMGEGSFWKELLAKISVKPFDDSAAKHTAVLTIGNKELFGRIEKFDKPLAVARPVNLDKATHSNDKMICTTVPWCIHGFITQKLVFCERPVYSWTTVSN